MGDNEPLWMLSFESFKNSLDRGKSVETVKIQGDPIQIADNKSEIIDTAQLRFHTSKLLSSCKVQIR